MTTPPLSFFIASALEKAINLAEGKLSIGQAIKINGKIPSEFARREVLNPLWNYLSDTVLNTAQFREVIMPFVEYETKGHYFRRGFSFFSKGLICSSLLLIYNLSGEKVSDSTVFGSLGFVLALPFFRNVTYSFMNWFAESQIREIKALSDSDWKNELEIALAELNDVLSKKENPNYVKGGCGFLKAKGYIPRSYEFLEPKP